jgi:WD40 repeat protein
VLSAILRDDRPPLRTLVPGTPRAVERCVVRCLDKDRHGASWSPDGNWIAYRRMRMDGKWELAKAPLGGGAVVRLDETTQGGSPTDWSPSGDWIVAPRPDGVLQPVSPDGSAQRTLAGLRSPWFRFSHEGARLFVVRAAATRGWELVT